MCGELYTESIHAADEFRIPKLLLETVDIAVTLRLTENGAAIQHTVVRMTDKLKERGLQTFVFIILF